MIPPRGRHEFWSRGHAPSRTLSDATQWVELSSDQGHGWNRQSVSKSVFVCGKEVALFGYLVVWIKISSGSGHHIAFNGFD